MSEAQALKGLGMLELGAGNVDAAITALEKVVALAQGADHCGAPADLCEAYLRAGRQHDASATLTRLQSHAQRLGGEYRAVQLARCRALLADGIDAELLARGRGDGTDVSPFERARGELAWGEKLRRTGLRKQAREHLHAALGTFEALTATTWAEQTRQALRASGQTARRRTEPGIEELTPQELQVALLAADGATNREIGARLYLSPKTIELHLGRVYRKLGLRSRTELARAMPR